MRYRFTVHRHTDTRREIGWGVGDAARPGKDACYAPTRKVAVAARDALNAYYAGQITAADLIARLTPLNLPRFDLQAL